MISIIIPTVPGREEIFEKVRSSYIYGFKGTGVEFEILVEYDHPTVGCAWQAGAERARGEYIHMGNDDCIPHWRWWEPAIEAVNFGYLPSPVVFNPEGVLQSLPKWGELADDWADVSCATIPFLSRVQWECIQPLFLGHYYSDNWITERAKPQHWHCVLRHGYAFTHYWASHRRGAGMGTQGARDAYDKVNYQRALAMAERGEWNAPWPPGGKA